MTSTQVKANKKVINFLQTCGNQNLMYLLEPARLQQALAVLDTDRDGQIDASEWEDAIENALKAKLQARAAQRRAQEMMARQAAKELEEFTNEFKNAARHCFELIDVDKGGSLSKEEIVNAVHPKTGIEVANAASYNRANFNLRGLRDLRNCCFRVFGVWWCRNNRTTASRFVSTAGSD